MMRISHSGDHEAGYRDAGKHDLAACTEPGDVEAPRVA
jgi:hypothetical protein